MSSKLLAAFSCFALLSAGPAAAGQDRLRASLLKLEPDTRFHQLCDIETMRRIEASGAMHPDRMVMDARQEATLEGDTITGKGAAIRSAGHWYRLTFVCSATPDRLTVTELTYRLGEKIPDTDLELYGLWR